MNRNEQNSLSIRFLKMIRSWINDIIPEQTRECIRSKAAMVVKLNGDETYNIILSGDLGLYNDLVHRRDMKPTDPDYDENLKLTPEDFNGEVAKFSIDNLFTIKNETYNLEDYVIVGYLDNKLTNAFILCKNRKKGE